MSRTRGYTMEVKINGRHELVRRPSGGFRGVRPYRPRRARSPPTGDSVLSYDRRLPPIYRGLRRPHAGPVRRHANGSNYWLYGYYGSGKSHLLTVLDGLLDTDWLDGQQDAVWSDLVQISGDSEFEQLGDHWRTIHDEYYVIPISVNLLKYQGQKQRSFSEIVLRHAHQDADLTGVDDGISEGLSSQLDVAYFEKWFRTTDAWSDRQARAEAALDGVTTEASDYEWQSDGLWKDIQKYGALADVVLPKSSSRRSTRLAMGIQICNRPTSTQRK